MISLAFSKGFTRTAIAPILWMAKKVMIQLMEFAPQIAMWLPFFAPRPIRSSATKLEAVSSSLQLRLRCPSSKMTVSGEAAAFSARKALKEQTE